MDKQSISLKDYLCMQFNIEREDAQDVFDVFLEIAEREKAQGRYDLSKEIDFESTKVIEQGTLTSASPENIQQKVGEIINHYQATIVPRTKTELIAVLVGSSGATNAKVYYFRPVESPVGISTDGSGSGSTTQAISVQDLKNCVTTEQPPPSGGAPRTVLVSIDRGGHCQGEATTQSTQQPSEFTFNLKEGENFFIVLIKEKAGETFVASSDQQVGE